MADIESTQGDYPVRLEAFEGPLDLLLYLIKKDEVDIHDIPIESITRQFNEYLNMMKMLDLNIAGEFLVMSATLMHIKSRMLLPEEERSEELEDEEDPRWDLVRQLVEYKKFRDAALHLEKLEDNQHNVLLPPAEGIDLGQEPGLAIRDVSLFDLVRTLGDVLARARREVPHEIASRAFSVAEKIDHIVRLTEDLPDDGGVSLLGLFEGMEHRAEIVCTFLAVLELIRMRRIRAVQTGLFGDIEVRKAPPAPPEPEPAAPEPVPEEFLAEGRRNRRKKANAPAEEKTADADDDTSDGSDESVGSVEDDDEDGEDEEDGDDEDEDEEEHDEEEDDDDEYEDDDDEYEDDDDEYEDDDDDDDDDESEEKS